MSTFSPDPASARDRALAAIDAEHKAFDAALAALVGHLGLVRAHAVRPDPGLFERSLAYVATFMDRFHHPNEDEHLFKALRARTGEADGLLATLQHDHAQGPGFFRDLARSLAGTRTGETRFEDFGVMLERYAREQLEHMRVEGRELLPLAQRVLKPSDWRAIDAAFRHNRDPLFGAGGGGLPGVIPRGTPRP